MGRGALAGKGNRTKLIKAGMGRGVRVDMRSSLYITHARKAIAVWGASVKADLHFLQK